jgi:threonine aldolase
MYKINYGWLTVMSYGLIRMYHLRYRSYMSMAITVNGHTCGESLVKNRLESMVRNRVFRKQSGNLWNTLGKTYGKT